MRKFLLLTVTICILFCLYSHAAPTQSEDVLHQVSTIDALLEGVYEGTITFADLQQKGDFGIGTFNFLDGEMLAVDGEWFQIKSDGKVYPVESSMKTPFAAVTKFESDQKLTIKDPLDYEKLKKYLLSVIPTKNLFYAIKVKGLFSLVKTRSVPRQEKPYEKLVEIVKNQPEFSFKNIKGTLVGFWCPDFVKGLNVPGYHFHFISEDKKVGGHLLDVIIEDAVIDIDQTSQFFMTLPESNDYFQLGLEKENEAALKKVEQMSYHATKEE